MASVIDTILLPETPDFSFMVVENRSVRPDIKTMRYISDPPRLRSVGEIGTILEMSELMSKSFEIITPLGARVSDDRGVEKFTNKNGIYFAPDYPEFLVPKAERTGQSPLVVNKVITWSVVRREPGTRGGKPFDSPQEIKPQHREYLALFKDTSSKWITGTSISKMEDYGGLAAYLDVYAQTFDNYVQFNLWARTNYEAETLAEWFEDYMDLYTGMYREAGIVQMYFVRRMVDENLRNIANGYHVRSVLYYVRTEKVRVRKILPITRINLNVSSSDLRTAFQTIEKNTNDMDTYDKVLRKWHVYNVTGGI